MNECIDTKMKKYIDEDVLTMAKKRINHIIDAFDNIIVCFSGGKDSLVVLNLVQQVYNERGINSKVKVIFRDEELIPDNVIEFVQEVYKSGKYDFRYYAIPLHNQKFVLGKATAYIQWDRNREWIRQPPEYAIRLKDGDNRVFTQYDADEFICKDEKGSVALVTGIRADESIVRLRSVVNKKNEPYINATQSRLIKICKPIYDWTEKDVFLFLYQNKIRYNPVYDEQMYNNETLRVASSLNAEASKNFDKLATRCPDYYQQVIDLFPEMIVHSRYRKDFYAKVGDFTSYAHSITGIIDFINDTYEDPVLRHKALEIVRFVENQRIKKKPCLENNFCGYPLLYVFKSIASGSSVKRKALMPCPRVSITKAMIDFELT